MAELWFCKPGVVGSNPTVGCEEDRTTQALTDGGPKDAIRGAENLKQILLSDPDFALIQERWPKLPKHIKAAVLALVRSTSDKEPSL